MGTQDPRRDDGRDRVGSVVQPIEKVKGERDCDQTDEEGEVDGAQRSPSDLIDDDALDFVRHIAEAIDHLFQVIENLCAGDKVQPIVPIPAGSV
jgi:hypothetical protein